MYKKLALALLCAIAVAFSLTPAHAGTLEDKVTFGDKVSHSLSMFEGKQFGKSTIGWSAFFLASEGWSEGYAGPTWSPAKWMTVSASIGLQSAGSGSNPIRYASDVWVGNSLGSVYAVYERGAEASDNWWKVKPMVNIGSSVKLGAFLEKGKDVAPVLEVSIAKTGVSVWGAYYKDESQLGLKYSF